jgi:hypothetical protein
MNNRIVYDTVLRFAPSDRKRTPGGWISFNCPCCIHNKQARPDTKKRFGMRITSEGATSVHCFNCHFSTTWIEGRNLSPKFENLFKWMALPDEELKKIKFKIWQLKENAPKASAETKATWVKFEFFEKELPKNAKPFSYWIEQESYHPEFLKVLDYMSSRGNHILTAWDYWWTPDRALNGRVIIPFTWDNKVVGCTSRATFPTKYRYLNDMPTNYMFNTESIKHENEFIILVEGPFDAIAINGVATLGDHLSLDQCQWLNNTGKKIIVLPDREKEGGALVDIALRENWFVSFPPWDTDVKDAADASKKYGKLYTLWSVLDSRTNNKLNINIRRQMDLKYKKEI